jgi:hypothetical protein
MTLEATTTDASTNTPRSEKRSISKHPAVQTIGYLAAMVLGLPPAIQRSTTGDPIAAVLAAVVWFLILGALTYAVRTFVVKKQPVKTFKQVAFGRGVVIATVVLLIVSASGAANA